MHMLKSQLTHDNRPQIIKLPIRRRYWVCLRTSANLVSTFLLWYSLLVALASTVSVDDRQCFLGLSLYRFSVNSILLCEVQLHSTGFFPMHRHRLSIRNNLAWQCWHSARINMCTHIQSRAKSNATMQNGQQYCIVTCCLFCVVMVTSKHTTGYQR